MERYVKAWTTTNLLIRQGESFSGNEPHCCFLNTGQLPFADISAVSGLNLPEDGRSVAITDWDGDGDLDLWMTHRTAPRIRFFRNDYPSGNHFLQVRLEGKSCNRDAIGARLELYLSEDSSPYAIKSVRAGDGFLGQSSKRVHFGLGQHRQIDRLVVRWPGGKTDTYRDLEVDRQYFVVQGNPPKTVKRHRTVPLSSSPVSVPPSSEDARVLLTARLPLPQIEYENFDGQRLAVWSPQTSDPILVTLWASWCQPCLLELQELARGEPLLRPRGLRVLALCVDRLDETVSPPDPLTLMNELKFPYESGLATKRLVNALDIVQRTVLDRKRPLPIPSSFLVTRDGQLAAIYRGRVEVPQILADLKTLDWQPRMIRDAAVPFPGRWSTPPQATDPMRIAVALYSEGIPDLAKQYSRQIETYLTKGMGAKYMTEATRLKKRTEASSFRGVILLEENQLQDAVDALRRALEFSPRDLRSHMKLGEAYGKLGEAHRAAQHLAAAVSIAPNDPILHYDLAIALTATRACREAVDHYWAVLKLRPGWPPAANNLAWILATHPDPTVRKGDTAVEIAEEVCRRVSFRDPTGLDTLAVALAETGDFERAVQQARKAIELADSQGKGDLAQGIRERLQLYSRQVPYRDTKLSP